MNDKQHKQSRSKLLRGSFGAFIAFSLGVALMVTGSSPDSVGLLGIVGFFLLLLGGFFSLFLFFYALRQRSAPLSFRGILKAAILALGPVMLLALSSTGALDLLDILLVSAFVIAALFYVSRAA